MKKNNLMLGALLVWCISPLCATVPMYFCMAADAKYYTCLLNLIGNIHALHASGIEEIAVFDIGLAAEQRVELNKLEHVTVHDVEVTHPDLLTLFSARNGARNVPGWYAWKAVVLKQALDMFPHVLYIDAGVSVRRNLQPVFEHMLEHDHVFFGSTRSIAWMSTEYVINTFKLRSPKKKHILAAQGMLAGIQGVTRAHYQDYVLPMYALTFDLRNFAEDGSNKHSRHDQPLFSIHAYLAGLSIMPDQERGIHDTVTNTYHEFHEFFDIVRFN